jgi:hypothetical protein
MPAAAGGGGYRTMRAAWCADPAGKAVCASTTTASTTAITHITPQNALWTDRQLTNRSGRISYRRSRTTVVLAVLPCTSGGLPDASPRKPDELSASTWTRLRQNDWVGAQR